MRVVLGPDGLPESFRVAPDWHRKLAPEAFGGAVLQACEIAMRERLTAWTRTLEKRGWRVNAERLHERLDEPLPAVPPTAVRCAAKDARSRDLGDVAEDMIKAFNAVGQLTPPRQPAAARGSSALGQLVITLSTAGLTSCTVSPRWVSGQTASRLTNALGAALTAARAQLPNHVEETELAGSVDRLLVEVFALLDNHQRFAQP